MKLRVSGRAVRGCGGQGPRGTEIRRETRKNGAGGEAGGEPRGGRARPAQRLRGRSGPSGPGRGSRGGRGTDISEAPVEFRVAAGGDVCFS